VNIGFNGLRPQDQVQPYARFPAPLDLLMGFAADAAPFSHTLKRFALCLMARKLARAIIETKNTYFGTTDRHTRLNNPYGNRSVNEPHGQVYILLALCGLRSRHDDIHIAEAAQLIVNRSSQRRAAWIERRKIRCGVWVPCDLNACGDCNYVSALLKKLAIPKLTDELVVG